MDRYRQRTIVPKVPPIRQLHDGGRSALARYRDKVLGEQSGARLVRYELVNAMFGDMTGALGYQARKMFFRGLFRHMGSSAILGRGLVIRHPGGISLGNRVAVDDYVMLDASGAGSQGVTIGDEVLLSRNCIIQGKTGPLSIGSRSDIGCNTVITSISGITVGDHILIGGNCYIGGGRYVADRRDVPIMDQGMYSRGPVVIEDDVWIGAGAMVLDGVQVRRGSIIGAGALVTRDVPEYTIVAGVPARVVGLRT